VNTFGVAPSRYIERSLRAAARARGNTRSDPEIFAGSGVPKMRDAQTTHCPSATARSAAAYAARSSASVSALM